MSQLSFSFVLDDAPPPPIGTRPSRTTAYWRRRIDKAARAAFELGKRQRKRQAVPQPPRAHALGADVVTVRTAWPCKSDRNELSELAARVRRLSVDRRDPERFFVEKSEIESALRAISKRS